MPLDLMNLVAKCDREDPTETARLKQLCSHSCPNCQGPICVGEDEAAGICSSCYFTAVGNNK